MDDDRDARRLGLGRHVAEPTPSLMRAPPSFRSFTARRSALVEEARATAAAASNLGPGLGLATGEASAELREPGARRRAHGVEVRAEAVVARYDHHAAPAALRRHAERVAIALHDEHGNVDLVELVLARLGRIGPAGSVHRKRKAEHGHRAGLGRRP